MGPAAPNRVEFSRHAVERARAAGHSLTHIADLLLDRHRYRRRNHGSGDWMLRAGALRVIYDWRADGDLARARVVTVWRER